MHRISSATNKKTSSLADERLRDFTNRLDSHFKSSSVSSEALQAILHEYAPSSTMHETILHIYSNSLNKPTLNRLLDKSVEQLQLNDTAAHPVQLEKAQLIHHAIMKDYEHIFQLLINSGLDVNSLLSDCKTPLSIAVVASNLDPAKRLFYIQYLLAHGANATLSDANQVSPFKRLCGMESNYPKIYTFFLDHLYSVYPDQVQNELNAGLANAVYNWCVPIVTDLLERGATLDAFQSTDGLSHFFAQIATTFFQERRSVVQMNAFILCLIQMLVHQVPCVNHARCIEMFFELIYIPGVCFETNNDPLTYPSVSNIKTLLSISTHYGYLTKQSIQHIRTELLPRLLTIPIQNPSVTQAVRQHLLDQLNQHINELIVKYHQSAVSLTLLATRKLRQAMKHVTQEEIKKLNISQHLMKKIL